MPLCIMKLWITEPGVQGHWEPSHKWLLIIYPLNASKSKVLAGLYGHLCSSLVRDHTLYDDPLQSPTPSTGAWTDCVGCTCMYMCAVCLLYFRLRNVWSMSWNDLIKFLCENSFPTHVPWSTCQLLIHHYVIWSRIQACKTKSCARALTDFMAGWSMRGWGQYMQYSGEVGGHG